MTGLDDAMKAASVAPANDSSVAMAEELDRLIDEINSQPVAPPSDTTGAFNELMKLSGSTPTEQVSYSPLTSDGWLPIFIVVALVFIIVGIKVFFEIDRARSNETKYRATFNVTKSGPKKIISDGQRIEHIQNYPHKVIEREKSPFFVRFFKKLLYYIFIILLVVVLPPSIKGLAFIILPVVWVYSYVTKQNNNKSITAYTESPTDHSKRDTTHIRGVSSWYDGLTPYSKKELSPFYDLLQGIKSKKDISKMIDTYYEKNLSHIYASEDKVYKDLYTLKDYL